MAKVKHIECKMFESSVYIFIGKTVELKSYIENVIPEKYRIILEDLEDLEESRYDGVTYYCGNICIIRVNNFSDLSILIHELMHATYRILNIHDINLDHSTNEVYAYMIGYLTKEALNKKDYEIYKK